MSDLIPYIIAIGGVLWGLISKSAATNAKLEAQERASEAKAHKNRADLADQVSEELIKSASISKAKIKEAKENAKNRNRFTSSTVD